MTIIQPPKSFIRENLLSFFLAAGLLLTALFYVYQYNSAVNLRYEIKKQGRQFSQNQIENVALKSVFHGLISSDNLEKAAAEKNLVMDDKPEYFNSRPWVTASQF